VFGRILELQQIIEVVGWLSGRLAFNCEAGKILSIIGTVEIESQQCFVITDIGFDGK
jgi:hypothetical protein